ncbi:MAG: 30S ribosome-binding factor RbfA [Deltaproteobacteria bacterium]|jgi:ribosome-binding factor A|nr:30S ribosome-binding factor RbfA [Deltaproteobacteria bacterium]
MGENGGRRREKTEKRILDFVGTLFLTKMEDPRLRGVTITRARVSEDLRHAKIFYSLLDPGADADKAKKALDRAKSFVRTSLARGVNPRHTPDISFVFDQNPGHAGRIAELLALDKATRPETDSPESDAPNAADAADEAAETGSSDSGETETTAFRERPLRGGTPRNDGEESS